MNVLFLLDHLTVGGAERQTCVVTNALAERGHGASMMIIAGERPDNFPQEILPPRTDFLGLSRIWSLNGLIRTGRALKQSGADIVAPVNQTALVAAVIGRLLGLHSARIACVFHTTIISTPAGRAKLPIFYTAARLSDAMIYVSENQRKYWEGRGLKAPFSAAITNGIVAEEFEPATADERRAARSRWGVAEDEVVVALCARFHPEKNQQQLVRAAAILSERGARLRLLFIGDGPTRPTVAALAESLQILDQVIFAGEHRAVRPFLAAADVFVLSSKAVETFSIAALEGMAMGLPAVLSDIGGASEMVADDVNGYLFPVEDTPALVERLALLLDTATRRRLGAAAAQRVRGEFTAERMIDRYEAIFSTLLSPKP